jgi:hypothetical protein
MGKGYAFCRVMAMNPHLREPRMGEGIIPLFVAAIVFWGSLVSIFMWLSK